MSGERKYSGKQILTFLLKLLFVGGLLYFLVQKGFISLKDTRRAFTQWDKLLPAVIAMGANAFLGALRWQWLLKAQGIELKWGRTLQLTFVGNFFNIALPGAVSGDFVKAFYVGKETQGRKSRAFGTILFDRVAGLSALAIVSAGALSIGFNDFKGTILLHGLRFVISSAAVMVILFYSYLFLVREHQDPLLYLFRSFEKRLPKAGSLTRIYESIRHYHNHRWVVIKVLVLSIFIHIVVGWSCMNFAQALGDQNIPSLATYVVVPLGLLVTAIPIMPAGVGTGHAAFLYLFQLMGSQRGADVFTLLALFNLCVGAVGGLVYLRFRSREPEAIPSPS